MKEPCFAERQSRNRTQCIILDVKECIGCDFCSSYKSANDIKEQNEKVIKRLRSLPMDQQKHIEEKYKIKIW